MLTFYIKLVQIMKNCIFCGIIGGRVRALTVYEDSIVKAVADINPVTEGHTLIITKNHYETIFDIPEEEFLGVASATKKLAKIFKSKLHISGVNLLNASGKSAQQSIPHFHIHMIPRHKGDGVDLNFHGNPKLKAKSWKTLKTIVKHNIGISNV